ncbi:helix-turn-helix domain-containing protein [Isoptericola sp. NPDC057653]|uniref:helix-turn-helix domain-containing protein n=1 Tax=Isoptericola sp. NPDC057653 TaxID=3346195 RepID=UPI00368ACDCB
MTTDATTDPLAAETAETAETVETAEDATTRLRRATDPFWVPATDPDLDPDVDDAEGGPGAPRPRRRARRLLPDGLAEAAAGAIRYESARRGMTQQDLSLALGRSRSAVSARYTGQVPWSLDDVGRLASLYGCHVTDLLTEPPRVRSPW